jgi:hypothetical protein
MYAKKHFFRSCAIILFTYKEDNKYMKEVKEFYGTIEIPKGDCPERHRPCKESNRYGVDCWCMRITGRLPRCGNDVEVPSEV